MKKGILIVLEGPDRSGKTTQAGLLKSWLEGLSYKVRLTREPGGTAISERIREILLSSENKIKPMTELFLFETSRMPGTAEKMKNILLLEPNDGGKIPPLFPRLQQEEQK